MKRNYIPFALIGLSLLSSPLPGRAQYGKFAVPPPLPSATGPIKVKKFVDVYPPQPSVQPAFTIPLGSLGYSIPSNTYLLRKESMVSLDFLDEDRLLFTFHIAGGGLMSRDADEESSPHQIQAEVLTLPGGHIESKTTWIVPDRLRYLWMLDNGHFLLRGAEGLDEGDAQLKMKSYLRLPGRLLWIEMDPTRQILMVNSLEHGTATSEQATSSGTQNSDPPEAKTDKEKAGDTLVVRTMKRETGEVIHVSQVPWTKQTDNWPMNARGYVERLSDKSKGWVLKFTPFSPSGKSWLLAGVESTCAQKYNFLTDDELLVTTCDKEGGWSLKAVSTEGKVLWKQKLAWNVMWPLLVVSPDGLRAARQTLLLKRMIDHYQKQLVGASDLQGQMVRVFDAADGKKVLEAPLNPMFDNGGNVAISPSGKRVAILSADSIQVFQLPAPAPAPKGSEPPPKAGVSK